MRVILYVCCRDVNLMMRHGDDEREEVQRQPATDGDGTDLQELRSISHDTSAGIDHPPGVSPCPTERMIQHSTYIQQASEVDVSVVSSTCLDSLLNGGGRCGIPLDFHSSSWVRI